MNTDEASCVREKTATGVWNASLGDWDPSLETGMELIDRQHKVLFEQIRILLDRSEGDRVQETLKFMATYAVEHFMTEEDLHQETDYPQAWEHFVAHNRFTTVFGELKREYDNSGQNLVILMKLAKFLSSWLREHIREEDRQFADYFHRLGPLP